MVKVRRTVVSEYGVEIELDNRVRLHVSPNPGYLYFTLSGIDVPTHINPELGDKGCSSNNTLVWKYKLRRD